MMGGETKKVLVICCAIEDSHVYKGNSYSNNNKDNGSFSNLSRHNVVKLQTKSKLHGNENGNLL